MVKVPLGQGSFAKVPLDQVPLGQVPLVKVPLTPNPEISRVRVGSSSGSQFQSYLPLILRVRLHHYQKLATFEKVVLSFLMWTNLSVAVATFLSKKES